MCMQCCTDAMSFGEVVPGWDLMRARKGYFDKWPEGWWGLVECNDPDIVWQASPMKSPLAGWTDDEIDACPPMLWELDKEFMERVRKFEESVNLTPNTGYDLVKACIAGGYSPEENGNVLYWLFHRMGEHLESVGFNPEPRWESTPEGQAWLEEQRLLYGEPANEEV